MKLTLGPGAWVQIPPGFEYLPHSWWRAAVMPLHIAHPTANILLELMVSPNEPLPEPHHNLSVAASTVITVADAHEVLRRRIVVPAPQVMAGKAEFQFVGKTDPLRAAVGATYSRAYEHAPIAVDTWRQWRNYRVSSRIAGSYREPILVGPPRPKGTSLDSQPARAAVWIAMHWLEPGGAESWAVTSARLAQEAGFEVIITADRPAPQATLDQLIQITPHVYIPAHSLVGDDWELFVRGLIARHDLKLVHIHHSAQAYRMAPWLKLQIAGLTIVDSTHVLEHRTGGFVAHALAASEAIDLHHVISPQLRDHLILGGGVPSEKVQFWPLTHHAPPMLLPPASLEPSTPLRIGFLGRFAPQKRPLLFVELAARLQRSHPGRFAFTMQGNGVLEGMVRRRIKRAGLTGVIELRAWGKTDDFLSSVDVLVISSENEGLTLTSLEASEHGVLVISADVGSQATVVPAAGLLPPEPEKFLRTAAGLLARLDGNRSKYRSLLSDQLHLVQLLHRLPNAADEWRAYLQQLLTFNNNRSENANCSDRSHLQP